MRLKDFWNFGDEHSWKFREDGFSDSHVCLITVQGSGLKAAGSWLKFQQLEVESGIQTLVSGQRA